MAKRKRPASAPTVRPSVHRGRPSGKCNELGAAMPVLLGKRSRTATKKDEEMVEAAPLRDKRLDVTEQAYRKRRKQNLGPGDKTRMLARVTEAAMASADASAAKKVQQEVVAEAGVVRHYMGTYLLPQALDESRGEHRLAMSVDNRSPSIFTEDVDEFMAGQALLWEGDFSWAELAAAVCKEYALAPGVPSPSGTRKHCLLTGWTDTRQRILPWLSEDHLKRRAAWASLYVKQKWLAWVDVDEKWFYTLKLHGRRKQAPGQKLPPRFCKHKAHIPKVMFLAATARPRPGFDGKVGFWRVAAPKTAKKTSKNHDKDDVYDEDVTMTAEHYFTMMTTQVFNAIAKGFRGTGVSHVIVQQDGAKPHTGKDVVARMNAIGAKLSPSMEVVIVN